MAERQGFIGFIKNLISDAPKPDADSPTAAFGDLPGHSSAPVGTVPRTSTPRVPTMESVPDDIAQYGAERLKSILDLSFGGIVIVLDQAGDELSLEVMGAAQSSRLIGKDGMTLDALQTLIRAMIFKKFNVNVRVAINTEDYKKRREEQIRAQAEKALNSVLTKNSRVSMRPMNAAERRLVHLIFEADSRVRTFSTGNGSYRHVVVEKRGPKSQPNESR